MAEGRTAAHVPYQAYRSKRHSRGLDAPPSEIDPPADSPNNPLALAPSNSPLVLAPPNNPLPLPNGLPSPPASSHSQDSPDSPVDPPAPPERPVSNPPPRKSSKFRHVAPLRKPQSPLPSSPLARAVQQLHSRTSSAVSLPLSQPSVVPPNTRSPPSISDKPLPSKPDPHRNHALPVLPSSFVSSPPLSNSSSTSSAKLPNPTSTHKPSASRSLPSGRFLIPYRPGFQPKGVYRPLTDEFLAVRKLKRDGQAGTGVEREKLKRRLEKLVDLHFPSPNSSLNTTGSPKRRPGSGTSTRAARPTSSIFDLDTYKNITLRDAGDLWKSVVTGNLGDSNKPDKRAIEQRITPWEEDSAVSKCPLCLASFHPLTNRKHHCRLCGHIICSLPVKNPQRPSTCSILFVVDSKTRKIEEVGEGVDYGVRKRRNANAGKPDDPDNDEKFLKGVRICRECRPILLREQYQQERVLVPTFVKLHEAFVSLEQEIEDALPQFQELILALNHNDQPSKEASAARKRLVDAFSQYDALAKRIKDLPCPDGPGGSQGRVQAAIFGRANLFLQKNMFPLQSLPKPSSRRKGKDSEGPSTLEPNGLGNLIEEPSIDPDSELARALQPLLEQEALLESFIEEATAQRKFEDVKSLKVNLQEIRKEIERMLNGIDVNSKEGKGKARR